MKLTDREWKPFKIKDIFQTFNGKHGLQVPTGAHIDKKDLKQGNIPRITVKDGNNGIDSFTFSEEKNFRTFENFISVSFLGSVFYHPYIASLDMKVHCLKLIEKNLNTYLAKFLIMIIKNNINNSSYGDQSSSTDLPQKRILIPVTEKGKPDYKFMEDYIKEKENKIISKYTTYLENRNPLGGNA